MSNDPSTTSKSVTVNLSVIVDAESKVSILNAAADVETDYIVCSTELPKSDLSDLIQFWEPTSSPGEINSNLVIDDSSATPAISGYKAKSVSLYGDFDAVLNGSMDCTISTPFSASKYNVSGNYYRTQSDFGRVALGYVADKLFGHVAATAAITNDVDYMGKMLAKTAGLDSWDKINESKQSSDVANLAASLVKTLIKKGFTDASENVGYTNSPDLTTIVKEVVGQDPSRARDQDNNQPNPGVKQNLKFYAGDVIFVSVRVKAPTVLLGSATTGIVSTSCPDKLFNLKITLKA
jgi:hypothetical protein